ncbi:hypothetical protein J6I39_06655 [bacterium]|nr:hypothetical protein [bacterium]
MEYKEWMKNVTPEDMPNDDLKFIACNAGLKSAMALILLCPGVTVTIPKHALNALKEKHIINHYDGTKFTLNKLAVDCELSQRYVYNLIRRNINKKDNNDSSK